MDNSEAVRKGGIRPGVTSGDVGRIEKRNSEPQHSIFGTEVAGGLTTERFVSSTRNFATTRKVQKLLDVTVNDNFRELVLYMNDVVPEFLEGLYFQRGDLPSGGSEKTTPLQRPQQHNSAVASVNANGVTTATTTTTTGTASSLSSHSSAALRAALEGRVVDVHQRFLQEWSTLNEVFEEVYSLVTKLHRESEVLEATLGAHAAQAEDFSGLMTTLQAELTLVHQREREIKEFQGRYHFTAEEQRILEEGSVDTTYLDVLSSVQATHRECRQMLLSRESYQSAAAVMDSTYIAIIKGTEKVARHLKTLSGRSTSGPTSSCGEAPELTNFYLRCMNFLREENKAQWASVVEEVARLRRAAVLRQYFHLLTTGSTTTASRTYHMGGGERHNSAGGGEGSSAGIRPLEAEIGNPVFFFSSLFAWLHQAIVDEDDFFSTFFTSPVLEPRQPPLSGGKGECTDALEGGRGSPCSATVANHFDEPVGEDLMLSKSSVLDSVFDVLCKHIQSVLEGVLERFLRTASNLQDADGVGSNTGEAGSPGTEDFSSKAGSSRMGPSGPIGLTGGIARLLSAAAGRPLSLVSGASKAENRYQHVMNRSQLEALVATTVSSLTSGLQTTHALLQLFTYCSTSTFTALLGRDAALTRLIADDGKMQLLRVYHTIAKHLSDHSLDSVAGVVSRSAILRRLASAEALEWKLGGTARYFVVDFLLEYKVEDERGLDGSSFHEDQMKAQERSASTQGLKPSSFSGRPASCNPYLRSGLSKHQAQAAELLRTLETMVLPVPPEVAECLRVLQATMVEAQKHAEIMESLHVSPSYGLVQEVSGGAEAASAAPPCSEQFFAVIVQHLMSFPTVLAHQPVLSSGVDEPCKLVIQLNTMNALYETLVPHTGSSASGSKLAHYTMPLLSTVMERIEDLIKELVAALSQCVARHYLGEATNEGDEMEKAICTPEAAKTIESTGGGDGEGGVAAKEFDTRTVMDKLNEFYSVVAASGRLYVPIVSSLASPPLRDRVMQGVLDITLAVYERRYEQLLNLSSEGGSDITTTLSSDLPGRTSVEDLHPDKLRILLDTTP
ncbi:hypothetical protein, conserved [Trypanosoma brucei brucei TREU927]|uniref:Conserved oligomeric Golgi complex subunit 6 n=1 Tax=Trypanosoma brucei brucei (strain 927/4 GUTat10.1) TaxID=185431 RepID=Q38BW6_TRYB2|nr:hypothetical protein, conserved [Trypanosoma brucei brucei TREU927]EAN77704.1 hypothetical protein, conserved [Trypanosoma brucei brucei TREU927]